MRNLLNHSTTHLSLFYGGFFMFTYASMYLSTKISFPLRSYYNFVFHWPHHIKFVLFVQMESLAGPLRWRQRQGETCWTHARSPISITSAACSASVLDWAPSLVRLLSHSNTAMNGMHRLHIKSTHSARRKFEYNINFKEEWVVYCNGDNKSLVVLIEVCSGEDKKVIQRHENAF